MSNMKSNKFEANKKYFTISVYTVFVVLVCSLIVRAIFLWDNTSAMVHEILSILSPFVTGLFIAFLLLPLVKILNQKLFRDVCKMKSDRLRDILAIICSYIIIIGVILIVIKFIVPQMASSVSDLGTMIPSWYTRLLEIVNDMEQKFPELDFTQFNKEIEDMGGTVFSYNNIKEVLGSVIPVVFTTSVSLVKGLISFLITIIVSCYVLFDRQLIAKNAKRFINAIFSNDVSNYLIATTKECSDIFSRYVTGKLLDSLIIGILCFIIMNILKLPYAVIISVIVGITNMIPYFGPFIGAVPGAFIILMISPVKMVIYLIMILVLQQFDGLVLGPKILGDSTGLRPVWIIFAVSTGGAVAGVIGMFLGVPVIAVIAYLTEKWIDHRLQKKERRAQSVEQNEQVHESSPTSLS